MLQPQLLPNPIHNENLVSLCRRVNPRIFIANRDATKIWAVRITTTMTTYDTDGCGEIEECKCIHDCVSSNKQLSLHCTVASIVIVNCKLVPFITILSWELVGCYTSMLDIVVLNFKQRRSKYLWKFIVFCYGMTTRVTKSTLESISLVYRKA